MHIAKRATPPLSLCGQILARSTNRFHNYVSQSSTDFLQPKLQPFTPRALTKRLRHCYQINCAAFLLRSSVMQAPVTFARLPGSRRLAASANDKPRNPDETVVAAN